MTSKTKRNSDNQPATKADIANLREDIDHLAIATRNTFVSLEKNVSGLKQGQASLEKGQASLEKGQASLEKGQASLEKGQTSLKENQERILSIVESIDNHFKEHRDIPRRVEQLEVDVFKLQTRQR